MLEESPVHTKESMIALTADIVAAYVGGNTLASADLPGLIQQIHAAVAGISNGTVAPEAPALVPAVSVKKSVTPDFIICLEDGKRFKSLKRHLGTSFNLTPDQYRVKWGLARDYPMVAPNYAATRSKLAKSIGLGNLRQKAKQAATTTTKTTAVAKRGPKPGKTKAAKNR
jgi:predicted transcriptional regulator